MDLREGVRVSRRVGHEGELAGESLWNSPHQHGGRRYGRAAGPGSVDRKRAGGLIILVVRGGGHAMGPSVRGRTRVLSPARRLGRHGHLHARVHSGRTEGGPGAERP